MSERYSRLFSLPENLYAEGAPVIIAAGALLKDNQTGRVVAQLKLRNISPKTIKAATVCLSPMNTVGNPLGDAVRYEYLDLSSNRDADFGSKSAIPMPDKTTRSFSAAVVEVIFTDNSAWNDSNVIWEPLKKPESLASRLDSEMVKQFRIEYGAGTKNFLLEQKDLWHCVCGAVNRKGETVCHSCRKSICDLKNLDLDALEERTVQRVAKEREQAEKKAAATQKIIKVLATVLVVAAAFCIVASFANDAIKKNNAYKEATLLMEQGKYEEAIEAFTALGNYKDSAYQIAVSFMKQEKYGEAIEAFTALGNYKDSAEQIEEANRLLVLEEDYQNAIQLLNSDNCMDNNEAYSILCKLGSYKNATELLKRFVYRVISAEYSGSKTAQNNGTGSFFYDDSGRLILETGPSWKHIYVYGANGKLIKDGSPDFQTEYQYGSNGKLISVRKPIMRETSGKITKTTYLNITYDESGYPLTLKSSNSGPCWVYEYQGKGETLHDSVRITVTYNEHKYSIDLSGYDSNKLCENAIQPLTFWIVNADGKQASSYELRLDAENGIYQTPVENCEYDAQMNLIRQITFDIYGKQEYEYHYTNTYDNADNLIKVERQTVGGTGKVVQEFKYGYIYAPNAK